MIWKKQTFAPEQVADAQHAERAGAGVLEPRAVAAQPDARHVAADVDGVADAAELAADRAADHEEQGDPAVTRSSRWIYI